MDPPLRSAATGDETEGKPVFRERGSTILRVLSLLEQIADSAVPVTAAELNRRLHLPKSTAHRLCNVMEQQGYLQKHVDGKRLVPGPRLRALAVGVLGHSELRAQRHTILNALSRDVGETCNLAYPDGVGMVYADRVETKWPLRMQLPVGSRVPLHCTASGKMYLSSLPAGNRAVLIERLDRPSYTENTLVEVAVLLEETRRIRKQDYSEDREEFVPEMIAIAAPIRDVRKRFLGTVAFHAPISRMPIEQARGFLPRLQAAARDLAALVGDSVEQADPDSGA